MIFGIPKEVKDQENRIALTPDAVYTLIQSGHRVLVETGAGLGSGFDDGQYRNAGAEIVADHAQAFDTPDLVVKVKEPIPDEYPLLHQGIVLFCFLHLAADPALTARLMKTSAVAISAETVQQADGGLPILRPMSEVAGRLAVQVGAHYLEKSAGGSGKLLSGVPGVLPAEVLILGAGTVGLNAARIAAGMGAQVVLIDKNPERLDHATEVIHGNLMTLSSNPGNIRDAISGADMVIGAVLVPGARAPRLVTDEMIARMGPGSVVIDVAVDQGGCIETCHPTTHTQPTYQVHGVTHYCVTNMPAAVPRTSTFGYSNALLPYVLQIAQQGLSRAVHEDPSLAQGVNVWMGQITHPAVAASLGLPHHSLVEVMA